MFHVNKCFYVKCLYMYTYKVLYLYTYVYKKRFKYMLNFPEMQPLI